MRVLGFILNNCVYGRLKLNNMFYTAYSYICHFIKTLNGVLKDAYIVLSGRTCILNKENYMGDKIFEYNKNEIRRMEFVKLLCYLIV